MSWNQRIIQAGRDLRRSLVQPLAQSWVNSEVRPSCLGPHPVRSWKPPRMETAPSLWAACHCALWGISCCFYLSVEYVHCLYSSVLQHCEDPNSISSVTFPYTLLYAVRYIWIHLHFWTSPDFSVSLHRKSVPAPNSSVTLCWTCCWCLIPLDLSLSSSSPVLFCQAAPQPFSSLCYWKSYSFPFVLTEIHRVPASPVLLDDIPALKTVSSTLPPPSLALQTWQECASTPPLTCGFW